MVFDTGQVVFDTGQVVFDTGQVVFDTGQVVFDTGQVKHVDICNHFFLFLPYPIKRRASRGFLECS